MLAGPALLRAVGGIGKIRLGAAALPQPDLVPVDPVALALIAPAALLILGAQRGLAVTLSALSGAGLRSHVM